MHFNDFLSKILSLQKRAVINVSGTNHKASFMASYTTEHFPDDEYIKLFFDDGTLLEIMPSQEEIFFCDDPRKEIDRNLITGDILNIDDKQFVIENANDNQLIKTIYYGDIADGEGGCNFSDYIFNDEVWSLATLDNGKISDVHAKKIDIKEVSFLQ